MVDVETSGLDPRRDRLLAIAAIGLRADWTRRQLAALPGDSFEVVVRQAERSSSDNILLHGIGAQRQAGGVPLPQAMEAFLAFAGQAPLLGFHVAFDRAMIERNAAGRAPANEWLDIEPLCAALHPGSRSRSLDDWMAFFGIRCARRHQAAADSWAQCEVLLRLWPRLAVECGDWRQMRKLAAQAHWVPRGP
jgi:DNA polymerase-3 subunit epsilon